MTEEGEEIMIPYVPNSLITSIKKDYPYIKQLLEYKRDATLIFLNAQGACAFYKGSLELKVEKEVKNWSEFKNFQEIILQKLFRMDSRNTKVKNRMLMMKKRHFLYWIWGFYLQL
jgi:hypothetical protein